VSLLRIGDHPDLESPVLVAAFDSWIDAGSASTTAANLLAEDATVVATFEADQVFDYRARRPTLEIKDGRPAALSWPELVVRYARVDDRDVLVLAGPEPDFRWRELAADAVTLASELGIAEWLSLGSIPAAVPHTRPVPVLGTESKPGLLRGEVRPGPAGLLRVPSAAISVLDMAIAEAGVPAVGYFAQVPHYVNGAYPPAALALVNAVASHLGIELPVAGLVGEAQAIRTRLDTATTLDESTREYIQRLEAMVDEERLPAGDELISEIERFLRDRGGGGTGEGRVH
jgi:predicted ATP-grasp superfamily ATP-dependent carboligase